MFRGKKVIQSKLAQLYNKHLKVLRHVSILTDHHQKGPTTARRLSAQPSNSGRSPIAVNMSCTEFPWPAT